MSDDSAPRKKVFIYADNPAALRQKYDQAIREWVGSDDYQTKQYSGAYTHSLFPDHLAHADKEQTLVLVDGSNDWKDEKGVNAYVQARSEGYVTAMVQHNAQVGDVTTAIHEAVKHAQYIRQKQAEWAMDAKHGGHHGHHHVARSTIDPANFPAPSGAVAALKTERDEEIIPSGHSV